MSAYIVDKDHILFLINAAMSRRINPHGFSWWFEPNGKRDQIGYGDYEKATEIGNLLWLENVKSVSARYPGESSGTLPGPIGGSFVIEKRDLSATFDEVDPVQVLKSCDCYEYQSCEHAEWKSSEAKAFIDALRKDAWNALPGYDAAEWGAPKANRNCVNLRAMMAA